MTDLVALNILCQVGVSRGKLSDAKEVMCSTLLAATTAVCLD